MKSYISRKLPLETRSTFPNLEFVAGVLIAAYSTATYPSPNSASASAARMQPRSSEPHLWRRHLAGATKSLLPCRVRQIKIADLVVGGRAIPNLPVGIREKFPNRILRMRKRVLDNYSG